MFSLAEFEITRRPRLRNKPGAGRTERVRRVRRHCLEVNEPGIPGGDNWWCPSQQQARNLALARARARGPGHRLVHDRRPMRGWPHYHVVAPSGVRVSGHYFYGGRPPRRLYRNRPWREFELELSGGGGKDHFVIQTRALGGAINIPAGHEVLTRLAADGLGFSAADVDALVAGVRRVDDVPLRQHFNPDQQMRHALRRSLCTPMNTALEEIQDHLSSLYFRALNTAGARQTAHGWVGEALHLIQDSFSAAHTERLWRAAGPPHPIRFIRLFHQYQGRPFPDEHGVYRVPDPRDLINTPGGALTGPAFEAVQASREFLRMMRRHLAHPSAPGNGAELDAFISRHLALSASPREPREWYRQCR